MSDKAICKKVSSMLSLYIDNKVTCAEKEFIENHLAECDECYKKYLYLKSLIKSLKDSYKQLLELSLQKQKQSTFSIREHERFRENLSPYVDNELAPQECFEFRKYLMKSKTAQKELKNTYIMQKEMRLAYDKVKKGINMDVSRMVMNVVKNQDSNVIYLDKVRQIISPKTFKIAILAGLVIFGAAELKHISSTVKPKVEKTVVQEKPPIKKDLPLKINR